MKCRFLPMNEDGTGGEFVCDTIMVGPGAGTDCLTAGANVTRTGSGELACWAHGKERPSQSIMGRASGYDRAEAGACVLSGKTASLRGGNVVCTPTPKGAAPYLLLKADRDD
jgi:hypothetical protein